MPIGNRPEMNRDDESRYDEDAPTCQICDDEARHSLAQEIREGLRKRKLWAPKRSSDFISAIFKAIDNKEVDTGKLAESILKGIESKEAEAGPYSCSNCLEYHPFKPEHCPFRK